ncbi:MAG: succinate--CoA ligase subunit beta [Methanomassiliicoccus sp.]|nr:succinate--CoA ligase subunit beta [Methanomassiliicoccus sp.]
MMLLEDRGKELFREHGIDVPGGRRYSDPEELRSASLPLVLKALVPVGGRGKAGGVSKVTTSEDAVREAIRILSLEISGYRPQGLLAEEVLSIEREMYLSIVIDRSLGIPVLLAGAVGGVEVESLPPDVMGRWPIHPFLGVGEHLVREVGRSLSLRHVEEFGKMLRGLWELFIRTDCELVEVNPLVLTTEGRLVAADSKVVVNDDAIFRHPEIGGDLPVMDVLEAEARRERMSFVRLDGDIGVIANGAGLTMATLDEVDSQGGTLGGFLDLGGTDDPRKIRKAFELMSRSGVSVILVNIFGGITRCDTVAEGVLGAMDSLEVVPFIVARIRGVNEELARSMLESRGIRAHLDLGSAVSDAVSWRSSA